MTDRERFGPPHDEFRDILTRVATSHGAIFAIAQLERIAGIRRCREWEQLSKEQRVRLLEEFQLLYELLS